MSDTKTLTLTIKNLSEETLQDLWSAATKVHFMETGEVSERNDSIEIDIEKFSNIDHEVATGLLCYIATSYCFYTGFKPVKGVN